MFAMPSPRRARDRDWSGSHQVADQAVATAVLESLLEPSRTIEDSYRVHTIQTDGGEVYSGLIIERSDSQVKLKNARGEIIEIATDEVVRDVISDKSMMPDGVLRDLSAQQAADLLSFLESLQH